MTWQDWINTVQPLDCLEGMKQMPEGCVDLVVTDPPYGVRGDLEWEETDKRKFAAFSMRWLPEVKRVSPTLIVFDSGYSCLRGLCELLWSRVRNMVWNKVFQHGAAAEAGLFFAHEPIFHCYEPQPIAKPKTLEVANMIRTARESANLSRGAVDMVIRGTKTGLCYRWEEADCLPSIEQTKKLKALLSLSEDFDVALDEARSKKADHAGAIGRDVFNYRTVPNLGHPCRKPDGLLLEIIKLFSNPGDLILDPFMGSGTTAVACKQLGRRFIGFEINPKYVKICDQRLAQEVLKLEATK